VAPESARGVPADCHVRLPVRARTNMSPLSLMSGSAETLATGCSAGTGGTHLQGGPRVVDAAPQSLQLPFELGSDAVVPGKAPLRAQVSPGGNFCVVSVPSKLFVGGVSAHTTTDALRGHFSKYGRILDAVVMQKNGRPRGFGFVTFDHSVSAELALAESQWLDGRLVDVKWAVPGERALERTSNKIFVGGLSQDVSTEELRAYFSGYGAVSDAVVMVDRRTSRSRGFGFVRFGGGAQGTAASEAVLMDFDRHRLGGKWVEVKRATPASLLQAESADYTDGFDDASSMECASRTPVSLSSECHASLGAHLRTVGAAATAGLESRCAITVQTAGSFLPDASLRLVNVHRDRGGRHARRRKLRAGSCELGGAVLAGGIREDASDDSSLALAKRLLYLAGQELHPSSPRSEEEEGEVATTSGAGGAGPAALAAATDPAAPGQGGVTSCGAVGSKIRYAPGDSENDPGRANVDVHYPGGRPLWLQPPCGAGVATGSDTSSPVKATACRDDVAFTREDFLSIEVRPWLLSW